MQDSCGHLVCEGVFLHSPVLLCGHIGLNKMKHRNRLGIFTLNSLLTVQSNVPQKCYEFKSNTELLKTRVNAMVTLLPKKIMATLKCYKLEQYIF